MKKNGFTLIELMIIVAIIGILASIAIPSFQKYRIKSFHASAASDVRNLFLFEQAFYTDHSEYVAITLADKNSDGLISKSITLLDNNTTTFTMNGLSNRVDIIVNIDANKQYANIGGFHTSGKKILAIESDLSILRSKDFSGTLSSANIPAASSSEDLIGWGKW